VHQLGHELRRPEADYLRDGICELRVAMAGVNYRMLCFFFGTGAAVVSHGLTKEQAVERPEVPRTWWSVRMIHHFIRVRCLLRRGRRV
jgi:hypothetical protein